MSIEVKSVKRMTTRSKTHQLLAAQQQQQQQQQEQLQDDQEEVEVSSTTVILPDVDDILPSPLTDVCEDSLLGVSVSSPLLSSCTFGSNEPTLSNDIDDDTALLSSSAVDDMLDDKINEPVIINEIKCLPDSLLGKSSCNSTPSSSSSSCTTSTFIANNGSSSDAASIITRQSNESTDSLVQQPQQQRQQQQQQQLHLITTTSASGTSALVVSGRVLSITNSTSASGNNTLTATPSKLAPPPPPPPATTNAASSLHQDKRSSGSSDSSCTSLISPSATLLTNQITKVTANITSGNINSQASAGKGRTKSTEPAGSKGNDCKIKVHCSHRTILCLFFFSL